MESFDVICNSKNCKGEDYPYFVPCMLKSPKKNTRGTNMRTGPLPVFLTFNTNYVPSGLFCRLVVHFWEWASQLCRDPRMAPSLFSNAARFNVSEVYQLTLECHKTVIKLIIWTQRDSDGMEEKRICEELLNLLERCRTRLSVTCPWLRSSTMELYVKCQLCEPCPDKCRDVTNICILHKEKGCSHFDCGHYIPLGSSGLSCEHSVDAVPDYPREKLDPWVQALKSIERKKRTGGRNEEPSPSDAVKQGVPSDEDLEWLSHKLENWEELGRRLGIDDATLTAFDDDYKKKRKKIYKMLRHWKKKDGSAATYKISECCPLFKNRSQVPSEDDLEWLSHRLEKWKTFGHLLKIEEARLTAFDDKNVEYSEKIFKMLLHRRERLEREEWLSCNIHVKQGVPSDEELEWLSHQLENWEELGRHLKIEQATLTAFDDDYGRKRKKIYKMLQHWKQKDGSDATYMVLHDALCHQFVNRADLAEKLCRQ
ncbi:hypothetical protein pdam_00016538 [Pocillopora damicornis]|uniref:Death domain-containing protein n=1 Tax=Pocillopora damicornis TaxID=46731 RepID=A0A3M6TFL0_POCDA|nr:hypothetical protein pdam_00016538 [Pocillopora damicornis]